MKRKLLLAALCVVSALGMRAQTDVTSTYLVNPSFETLKAENGTTDVAVKTTLSSGLYGWSLVSCSNYQVESNASGSSSGFVNGKAVSPTDGTYYYFNRQGWANKNGEIKTTTSQAVPAGTYYFSFDYKAADYSNNNNAGNNGTTLGIKVYGSDGSTTIASLPALRHSYSIANNGSNPGTNSYIADAAWKKMGLLFTVEEEQILTFSIVQNLKNNGRSDVLYDNCRLYSVNSDGTEVNVDITGMVANYDFVQQDANGWTNGRISKDQQYTGATNNYYLDAWDATFDMTQQFTLPAGVYQMAAKTRGVSTLETGYIYMTSDKKYTADIQKSGNTENTYGNGWGSTTLSDVVVYNASQVTYGFYSECGSSRWAGADDFTLTYVRGLNDSEKAASAKVALKTAIDAVVIPSVNVGSSAFQIPTSAKTALESAVGTAQGVYDNASATLDEVNNAITALNTAVETFNNSELNAPASGVQYRIKSTAADAAGWKNKYYVLKKNPSQPNGGYSTQAEVETTDAFYATAWEFVLVSGNQYKLRMTDADGDVRYLCTNITGYDQGSATQIRTTTDANKALVVKVIATGTEGRWFLQNTEDNSYLGGQDAGLFSNSQNYDLAIEAADKASVNVTIDAAVKYATRIFPFAAAIPDGVTAYSCAAVVGNTLTLVEKETSFDANTPYILEATNGLASTNLTGYGTASATSYEAGYLTGVYESTTAPVGSYVLQNNGKVGFYQVDDVIPTVGANRCYLTIGGGGSAKAFFFPGDDEATVIEGLDALTAGEYEAIYTMGGVKVNALQKGTNIVQLKSGKTLKINVK